jgi:hypothetical protein
MCTATCRYRAGVEYAKLETATLAHVDDSYWGGDVMGSQELTVFWEMRQELAVMPDRDGACVRGFRLACRLIHRCASIMVSIRWRRFFAMPASVTVRGFRG